MRIESKSVHGYKLVLEIPDKIKKMNLSEDEMYDAEIEMIVMCKPIINKMAIFFAYVIGSQDFESFGDLESFISNVAFDKLKNM